MVVSNIQNQVEAVGETDLISIVIKMASFPR